MKKVKSYIAENLNFETIDFCLRNLYFFFRSNINIQSLKAYVVKTPTKNKINSKVYFTFRLLDIHYLVIDAK